ncbi:MAG: G5 domain-containing protein [Candidatus Dojkabacteria bacterium]|nr:G5 domain-containing protein [Candidatus Dojkabacteria bacterium]
MKNHRLGISILTTCLLLSIPLIGLGVFVPYINAYEEIDTPNIGEIIFDFDSQEIENVYDLNLVTVIINGNSRKLLTNRTDISRLLDDLGVVVNNHRKIISTTENVQNGTVIRVITMGTVIEEENVEIPFRTNEIETKDIAYGDTEIVQTGVLGVRTKQIKRTYEDGVLVSEEILSEEISREPIDQILKVGVLKYSPDDLDVKYGYNCTHWYSVVDESNYTDQEKQWLKFVMECESGCNAESDKNSTYKGLFQWNPKYWDIFFPDDNIYDGYAQIKNTIWKVRKGANLYVYWPNCHRKYVAEYGEFIQ